MKKTKKPKQHVDKKVKKPRTTGRYTERSDEAMDDWLQAKYEITEAEHKEFDRQDHAHVKKYGNPKTLNTDREIDEGILEKIVAKRKKSKKKAPAKKKKK